MSQFVYPPVSVDTTGLATEATLLQVQTNTSDTVTELVSANSTLANIENATDGTANNTGSALNKLDDLIAKDYATQTTLAQVSSDLTALEGKDFATEATLSSVNSSILDVVASVSDKSIVFQIDATLLDTASTNIPASASLPLELVASTPSSAVKMLIVEDIGEYMGLYIGAAAAEVLAAVLPLGGGEIELEVATGVRVSIRAMANTAISSGKLAINFIA